MPHEKHVRDIGNRSPSGFSSLATKALLLILVPLLSAATAAAALFLVRDHLETATRLAASRTPFVARTHQMLGQLHELEIAALNSHLAGKISESGIVVKASEARRAIDAWRMAADAAELEEAGAFHRAAVEIAERWVAIAALPDDQAAAATGDNHRRQSELEQKLSAIGTLSPRVVPAHLSVALESERWLALVVIGGVVLGLAGGAIAMVFIVRAVRRIRGLEALAVRLAEGHPVELAVRGDDEIGRLEEAIAAASQMLSERQDRLVQRTRALEQTNLALRKAEEIRESQQRVLESMAIGDPLNQTLAMVERLLNAQIPDGVCSIMVADPDGTTLRKAISPGLPEEYATAVAVLPVRELGGCGAAAYRRQRVISEDIASDPLWADPRAALAIAHGLVACWATPLLADLSLPTVARPAAPKLLGTIAIYYRVKRRPTPQEMEIVDRAARLAAIGIEQWHIREELRVARERLQALLEHSHDMILVLDAEARIVYHSSSLIKMLNLGESSWVGLRFEDLVFPADLRLAREHLERAMSAPGVVGPFELRFSRLDDWRLVEIVASNLLDDPRAKGIVINARDVTERRRAEQERIASEYRYQSLFENARDMIYTHDLNGRFTSINEAAERLVGYQRDQALFMNILDMVAPEFRTVVRESWERQIGGDPGSVFEIELVTAAGTRVPVELSTRLTFSDGRPSGVQGIGRDLQERRQLELQLLQAQRLEAMGRLAGGVAHDFNNLLTVIKGYTQWIVDDLEPGHPSRDNASEALLAADRAAALTSQLLAFSRRQVLQPRTVNLNVVTDGIERLLRRVVGGDVTLIVRTSRDLGGIRADPSQIEQVLLNLVVNARDAMPGGGTVTIETSAVSIDETQYRRNLQCPPGEYVLLAVSDTGHGMDPATRERMFEPFFTTKEHGKGTGLGLSTVYGIVRQSGGQIFVDTEPGTGTVVRVYFPCVREAVSPAAPVSTAGGSETILLVEDENTLRRMIRESLERLGYKVLEGASGEAALRTADAYPDHIDLLLTDVVMPGIRGGEVAVRVSRMRPSIRVLFMSGFSDDVLVQQHLAKDSNSFIQKPFVPEALAAKIRAVLDDPNPSWPSPPGVGNGPPTPDTLLES